MIVLHDMEAPEKGNTAESVAAYFAKGGPSPSSAHYCIDNDSIVQCVQDNVIAYHAPPANPYAIGLEHAGYASQSTTDWLDDYGKAMLGNSIRLSADLCRKYNIQPVFLTVDDLKAGRLNGITTHANISAAFHKSTHTDPGPQFPIGYYMFCLGSLLTPPQSAPNPVPPPVAPAPAPTPAAVDVLNWLKVGVFATKLQAAKRPYRIGDGAGNGLGQGVWFITAALQKAGQWILPTGEFDQHVKDQVVYYQQHHGLFADGTVGEKTISVMYP